MLIFTRPSFESTTMTQSVSLTFSPFSTFHKMLLDDPWWQCHMLYRRKIYGECQNCPPQQFTYRQLVFPMVRYLGALAPGLDEGPGAGPQDCRGGVIDIALAALLLSSAANSQQLRTRVLPSGSPLLSGPHLPLDEGWKVSTDYCNSLSRSERNRVMQCSAWGAFNPSHVVPMPKSRWTQVGMEESAKA